ncbi:MAG: mechanosensitive ion channel domain-containing protein [Pseudomonadota bacterium]
MPLRRILSIAILSLVGLALSSLSFAQSESNLDPSLMLDRLDSIEDDLRNAAAAQETLVGYRGEIERMAVDAEACKQAIDPEVERLRDRYDILKDLTPDTDAALFDQYLEISEQLNSAQARSLLCDQIISRADDLLLQVSSELETRTSRYLWQRGASLPTLFARAGREISDWPNRIRGGMLPDVKAPLDVTRLLWLLIIAGLIGIFAGIFGRVKFDDWYRKAGYESGPPVLTALLPKPFATHAPLLLLGLALLAVLYLATNNASAAQPIVRVSAALFFYGLTCVAIDWMTGPLSPAAQVTGFHPDHVAPVRLRLRVFGSAVIASFVVLGGSWLSITPMLSNDPLVKSLTIIVLCVSLWFLIAYLGNIRGLQRYRIVRFAAFLCLATALLALAFGFQNFASYLTHGVVRTVFALLAVWLLLWLVFLSFETLIDGKGSAGQRVRALFGNPDSESRTGIGLFQLGADLAIWIGFGVYLVYVWDSSGLYFSELQTTAVQGFSFGEIKLVPSAILRGIAAFAILLALTGWIKRLIDTRWLRHMTMDRGARDAMVTLTGYVGFIIAVLAAFSVAGINLSGLAIVFGALSLGIGFGLQAIASNFVSGLILLFERPIKAGDFVTVGETEGFVRRIRIRATDIETLDNQNVLVPNSELVSGRVTNWVLRDPQGRLRIKVGVAYGSDTELVKSLIEQIGREHEDVISDGRAPAPRALFMSFGDSSLDFELRVRIRRIEKRFSVISDINFAIDKAFREHNIEIPFPQRDLHLINPPEAAQSLPSVPAPVAKIPERRKAPRPRMAEVDDDITRRIHHEFSVKTSLERVWTAITNNEKLQLWYSRDIDVAARIGGAVSATLPDDSVVDATIDVFMPPRRLRWAEMNPDGEGPLPSGPVFEEITLQQDGKSVTVKIDVFGIPASEDWEGYYRRKEAHWEASVAELRKMLRDRKSD